MTPRLRAALAAHALALAALLAGLWVLLRSDSAFYRLVQEDELLEWSSAWALGLAALLHLREARRSGGSRAGGAFLLGVAAFCAFVALEEISWGQRLFGLRPPEYFLEHNYQQETNVHNLFASWLRKSVMAFVLGGYGVVLPLLQRLRPQTRSWAGHRLVAPPLELAPLFGAALLLQVWYPVRFSGEWVELLLGLGLLFAPLLRALPDGPATWRRSLAPVGFALLVLGLALPSTHWSRHLRRVAPESVAAARLELEALARDAARLPLEKGAHGHARLHALVRAHGWESLAAGSFRALGVDDTRSRHYLDPWNAPYWLRYRRDESGAAELMIYSTGANRVRDSHRWSLAGDDLGLSVAWLGAANTAGPARAAAPEGLR